MLPIRTFRRRYRERAALDRQELIAPYQMVMYRLIRVDRKLDQVLFAKGVAAAPVGSTRH